MLQLTSHYQHNDIVTYEVMSNVAFLSPTLTVALILDCYLVQDTTPVSSHMRGGTKIMPPIYFLRKCNYNNNEIYIDD
jgi:hypothetical protein